MQLGTGNLECIRESLDVGDQGLTEWVQWRATEMVTCAYDMQRGWTGLIQPWAGKGKSLLMSKLMRVYRENWLGSSWRCTKIVKKGNVCGKLIKYCNGLIWQQATQRVSKISWRCQGKSLGNLIWLDWLQTGCVAGWPPEIPSNLHYSMTNSCQEQTMERWGEVSDPSVFFHIQG